MIPKGSFVPFGIICQAYILNLIQNDGREDFSLLLLHFSTVHTYPNKKVLYSIILRSTMAFTLF